MERPADLNVFWKRTLAELQAIPLGLSCEPLEYPLPAMNVYRLRFKSLLGDEVSGLFIAPQGEGPFPCIVQYLGFMSRVGEPMRYAHWIAMGCCVLVCDNRGQGGFTADSPYPIPSGTAPLAWGILDRDAYYQRRLYADAVRAVDAARQIDDVDRSRIILYGASQGGALSLAAASLTAHPLLGVFADVPSSCDIPTRIAEETGSYRAIADFIRMYPDKQDTVMGIQAYFDLRYLVENIKAPLWASVGGKDTVCPAKTFLKAYENIPGPKCIDVYPFGGHEGGGEVHMRKQLEHILTLITGV